MNPKEIEFADFSYLCRLGLYKACSKNCSEEICEEWKLLKAPTLADVCGKRELEDMTEEEFEDLRNKASIPRSMDDYMILDRVDSCIKDNNELFKWVIEHGFNVFGEEK